MQRFSEGRFSGFGTQHPHGCWVKYDDALEEIARLHDIIKEQRNDVEYSASAAPVPVPCVLPDPVSHEQGYANNLTEALRERNELAHKLDAAYRRLAEVDHSFCPSEFEAAQ